MKYHLWYFTSNFYSAKTLLSKSTKKQIRDILFLCIVQKVQVGEERLVTYRSAFLQIATVEL